VALDRRYQALTARMLTLATARARAGDVFGLQRLLGRIHVRDAALGQARPESVTALIADVEAKLDAARKLRLARDRWTLRAPALRKYQFAIRPANLRLERLRPSLRSEE